LTKRSRRKKRRWACSGFETQRKVKKGRKEAISFAGYPIPPGKNGKEGGGWRRYLVPAGSGAFHLSNNKERKKREKGKGAEAFKKR